jgi:MFS family permease
MIAARGSASRTILLVVAFAQFVVALDSSIIYLALPSIAGQLRLSPLDSSWVVNSFTVALAGFLLVGGRLADVLDPHRVFLGGLFVLVTASIVGALAQTAPLLIAARFVQGLSASAISPAGLAMLASTFTSRAGRSRAFGVWSAASGCSIPAGAVLGGILTSYLGWRSTLLVNVPLGAGLWMATARLPHRPFTTSVRPGVNIASAALLALGLLSLVYALVYLGHRSAATSELLAATLTALIALIAFAILERRSASPLMPYRQLRGGPAPAAHVISVFVGMTMLTTGFFVTLYLQRVLAYSPFDAGWAFVPYGIAFIISSVLIAPLCVKVGVTWPLVGGMTIGAASLMLLAQAPLEGTYASDVLVPLMLAGAALGTSGVALAVAALHGVEPGTNGLASGVLGTSYQVGSAAGLAFLLAIASQFGLPRTELESFATPAALDGLHVAFTSGAVLALVGAVLAALLMPRDRLAGHPDD